MWLYCDSNIIIIIIPKYLSASFQVWPQDIRDDVDNLNGVYRDRVYNMLKPTVYPEDAPTLHKMEAMKTAAKHIAKDIEDIEVDDIFKR